MARVECSLAELDALGAALDLAVWRFPFTTPHFGGVGRPELFAAVNTSLTRRGLIHGDRFDPDLVRTLRRYATGPVSIAVNGITDRFHVTALAVLGARHGVLATLREEHITFQALPAESMVRALVAALPPLPPGPGASVSVTGQQTTDAPSAVSGFMQRARPYAEQDRHAAQRILTRPRRGGGSFLINAPTRAGRPGPSETVSWIDTDAGRYAVTVTTGPDGRRHVTYLPADLARIEHHIHRLLAKHT
ncbi:ESX secretion-associated protein EspG [Actinokineospora sp.]|uniref:ESX secretion-associated protein EspG n=1 Tax=Actinokineospora sp. TaxID=1872133 RepID=UPI004037BC72